MKIYYKDRREPLKKFDDFSVLKDLKPIEKISLECAENEYFIIPLLITEANESSIKILMRSNADITCFNTEGTDKYGKPFKRDLQINRGEITPVYFGVDCEKVSENKVTIQIDFIGEEASTVEILLNLTEDTVENGGVNDLWRLSRLKWLNSDIYLSKTATKGYSPVELNGNTVSVLGRKISFGKGGMPCDVESFFDESVMLCEASQARLLRSPISFNVVGEKFEYGENVFVAVDDGYTLKSSGESERLFIDTRCEIGFEGKLDFSLELTAKCDCSFDNISLEVPFSKESSVYNMGLGKKGGLYRDIDFKWQGLNQDCLWVGGVNCGARVKWLAEDYRQPLINIYYDAQPIVKPEITWDNNSKGSVKCCKNNGCAVVIAQTDTFVMKTGEKRCFRFSLLITPLCDVDYRQAYKTRYYHTEQGMDRSAKVIVADAKKNGLNYIVVHHGNIYHPYINYPFIAVEKLRELVETAHLNGIGVKLYYTVREHGINMAETFVYKALGNEIIHRTRRMGNFSWHSEVPEVLTEYFGDEIIPAWRVYYDNGPYSGKHDFTFIVHPDSRINNYYVEGLKWLVDEIGIDGIYIDDTALDNVTLARARRILDERCSDKRAALIDMHMWNANQECAGYASPVNLYMDIFPFINSLWIGEEFPCKTMPEDEILIEVSGLPFGKTGQMLQDGGNPFVGMLYAMNNRFGWVGAQNTVSIYKLWDSFKIEDSLFRGFWDSRNPVSCSSERVLASSYIKADSALICVCNMSPEREEFNISVDIGKLDFEYKVIAALPEVDSVQKASQIDLSALQSLNPREGYFIILEKI